MHPVTKYLRDQSLVVSPVLDSFLLNPTDLKLKKKLFGLSGKSYHENDEERIIVFFNPTIKDKGWCKEKVAYIVVFSNLTHYLHTEIAICYKFFDCNEDHLSTLNETSSMQKSLSIKFQCVLPPLHWSDKTNFWYLSRSNVKLLESKLPLQVILQSFYEISLFLTSLHERRKVHSGVDIDAFYEFKQRICLSHFYLVNLEGTTFGISDVTPNCMATFQAKSGIYIKFSDVVGITIALARVLYGEAFASVSRSNLIARLPEFASESLRRFPGKENFLCEFLSFFVKILTIDRNLAEQYQKKNELYELAEDQSREEEFFNYINSISTQMGEFSALIKKGI
jgi:hypothetical protein